jgi:hypothetical protein
MRPVHVGILVLAGAIVGAVVMRTVERPRTVAGTATPATPAPIPVAPLPVQQPPAAQSAAAQPETKPEPFEPPPPVEPKTTPEPRAAKPRHPQPPPERVHRVPPPPANPRPLVVAKVQPHELPPAASPAESAPPPALPSSDSPNQAQENPTPQALPAAPQPENVTPPAPRQPHTVTLNAGLLIPVRLLDGLSSERNTPGDIFTATMDRDLVVDGFIIVERGARVEGRVVAVDRGGKVNGGAILAVELTRLHTTDRQTVAIETDPFEEHVQADHREDAEKLGAGAAIGAVIGALAGGGKGAAIGAGVGGGAGAVLLSRKPATLPSETRISFRLRTPVMLTEKLD